MLTDMGYPVRVLYLHSDRYSEDFSANMQRLEKSEKLNPEKLNENIPVPEFTKAEVIVDALYGSGLSKPIKGYPAEIVRQINGSGNLVISVDIPSGLFADEKSSPKEGAVINANITLTFQLPKLAFMFPENHPFVGEWHVLNIGLSEKYLQEAETQYFYLDEKEIKPVLKSRPKFSHKGNFGHALLIAGSYGKMGAAIMAARAAHRSGAGLVTAHVPAHGIPVLQNASPETMLSADESELMFSKPPQIQACNAIGIGPGLGTHPKTASALKLLIQETHTRLLLDADAINILAENKTWLSFLPQGCILTPHIGEFSRLTKKTDDGFERLKLQKEFSFRYQCYVVLKGAYTSISTPSGKVFFNSTGNPGMATGGSGDVLTGIILGLMAQGYESLESCLLAVWLHGKAGDLALNDQSYESLIASDITNHLGSAFKILY